MFAAISNVIQNKKAPILTERFILFCLFVACSYTSMKAAVVSFNFGWVWLGMLKVL